MLEALAAAIGFGAFAWKVRRDNKLDLEAEMRRIDSVPEEEFERIRERLQSWKDQAHAEQLRDQGARDADIATGTPFEQYVKRMRASGRGDIADRAEKMDRTVRY
jgi:hypothetical protein